MAAAGQLEVLERPTKPATPGELRLKLDLPETEPVHVRVVERGGEVHVLVRSNQPEAASRLASGLDQFHQSARSIGCMAETWLAASETVEIPAVAAEPLLQDGDSDGSRETGWLDREASQGDAGGRQRGGKAVPEWLELLSEREDETALRRFRKGRMAWRQ